ncbi:MAG: 3-phosphoshikimate 1-carboxyvinyltransferase [Microbacteriaceae bacterium]
MHEFPKLLPLPELEQLPEVPLQDPWPAPRVQSTADVTLSLPGSKSLTNREFVLAALASEPSILRRPLISRDTVLMAEALEQLGVGVLRLPATGEYGPDIVILPPEQFSQDDVTIDCGLAGTVMRFLPPMAALANARVTFTGDEGALGRPMKGITDGLRALNIVLDPEDADFLPFDVLGSGAVHGGEITIDASASSQFVSGLMLVGARFKKGLTIRHSGERVPSLPHIEMTIQTLRDRGIEVESLGNGVWRVPAGTIRGRNLTIEPDLSNAAPFLASALLRGGTVTIQDWPTSTTQVGAQLETLLALFGASFSRNGDSLTIDGGLGVLGGASFPGLDLDLSEAGELSPTIAGLCAFATSPSRLTGIGHLRGHETDRLAALAAEINALGGQVTVEEDGLSIVPQPLHGGVWHSYHDHRMATTGALIGLAVDGLSVENIATTAKTLPEFPQLWQKLAGQ